MKRIILILLLLVASHSLCAGKGRDRQLPEITYDSIRACWQGDSLQLRFRARIADRLPRGGRYIGLIPKLGETTFPAISYFRPTEAPTSVAGSSSTRNRPPKWRTPSWPVAGTTYTT